MCFVKVFDKTRKLSFAGLYYLFLLILFSAQTVDAQWTATYHHPNQGNVLPNAICQTNDGGYIVGGKLKSGISEDYTPLILKLDNIGNVQWQKTFTYNNSVGSINSIQQTNDGGCIAAGEVQQLLNNADENYRYDQKDALILKLDAAGSVQWQKIYGGAELDQAVSISQTSDGGYIVAGITDSFSILANKLQEAWIFKLDSSGNLEWQKVYGRVFMYKLIPIDDGVREEFYCGIDDFSSIQQTSDGGYIATGITTGTKTFIWVFKLNPTGNVGWIRMYEGDPATTGHTISQTSDGGYIISGQTTESLWVIKTNSLGDVLWQKTYGIGTYGNGWGSGGRNIQETSDGGYILAGIGAPLNKKYLLFKLDSAGNIQWQKAYSGANGGDPGDLVTIQQTNNGKYIVAGSSRNYLPQVDDMLVFELAQDGTLNVPCTSFWISDTNYAAVDTNASVSGIIPEFVSISGITNPLVGDSNATAKDVTLTAVDTSAFDVDFSCTNGMISAISPANGATDVAVNKTITATFSVPMDTSTINNTTFTVYDLNNLSDNIDGTVSYNGTTATFKPSSRLAYSTTYTAYISGVKDIDGNSLDNTYTWSFSTAIGDVNNSPLANAGQDRSVYVNDMVTLDGSGSSDADGDSLTYSWLFTSKPEDSTATFSNSNAVNPTFTVDKAGIYVVSLIVNDGTVDSQPDMVTISILNSAPLANAGQDQSAYVGNAVTLNGSGSSDPEGNPLTYSWTFSAKPDNSTAVLTNSTSASPTFIPDKLGTYIVSLTVNDGVQNSLPDTVTITTLNSAPIANAVVINQSVYVGNTVTLNGGNSSDVDGDTLTYSWTISSKPENSAAVLTNATLANPTFTADRFGTYVVSLTVNDGTVNSVADTVTITTLNSAPVADAGADQSAYVNNTVTLDGSGSSDVDGDTLAYSWTFASKPENSAATLTNATSVSPTFTADKFGTYVISLTVNDGTVNSVADMVTITTSNSAPVANAGPDQTPYVNETVTLNGGGSTDVDGDLLTYTWIFTSRPANSSATLSDVHAVNPTFTVDKAGTYVVSLMVNDGTGNSNQADTVTISTLNSAPVADAGADQSPYVTETVTLNGTGSTDVDGDLLTYTWAFTVKPQDSMASLSDPHAVSPTFTVDKSGTYVVSLIVNDGTVDSNQPDTVTISTLNSAPVANAGADQSPYVTETVTLNGAGSTDVDGDLLTYTWAFTVKPQDSMASLSDPHAVNPTFTVDKSGTYVVSLIVNDGTVDSNQPDTVTISTLNSAPVANAGADQSPYVTETVTLNGTGSTDVDGDLLTYTWAFTSKPQDSTATLSDIHAVSPTFTVDKSGTYVVSLIVNDGTVDSNQPDTVTISTLNSAPVANAGADQSPYVTETVTLNGAGSTDVDGDLLTYTWAFTSKPQDSTATLSDIHAVSPTFTVDKAGTYVVSLMVNDGTVDSQLDTVTISTLNSAPVADAGADQSPYVTETVTLNGAGSTDVDGDLLTYTWAFTVKPQDSTATLSDIHAVSPTFTVDKAGTYVVSLMVNDGTVDSQLDTVTISTLNSAPVADAGADQSPYVTETVTLNGAGSTDVDGDLLTYTWAFTIKPQDSTASLSDPHAVNPTFTVDKVGTYVVSLVVNDGTVDSNQPDTVTISTLNSAPVANAGTDKSAYVNDTVTLDGSGSTDVDGNLLTYTWAFTSKPEGSTATLSDTTVVNPFFTVDKAGTYVVSLMVNDGTVDSTADTVMISTLNSAPVAMAGSDQSPYVTEIVTLDGSGSTDVDGDLLTHTWAFTIKPQDSTAILSDPHAVSPTFTVDKAGTYVVSLVVNDGTVDSQPDTVTISTLNSAPVANAGADQSPYVTETVTLNGAGSTDVDGDLLTYTWAFTVKPQDSNAELSDVHAVNPTFTVDKAGTYVVSLVVNDGTVGSQSDTVIVTTLNSKPVANAGPDQSAYVNDTVTLDGSNSSDVDGNELTFIWAFTSKPAGSTATLSDQDSVNPTFTIDKAGTYVISLIVNDGTVDSLQDTVIINTINTAPKADAGTDQSIVLIGTTVQLNGSQSFDLDGDNITYQWAFTSKPVGSNASLVNSDTVTPTFVADVRGDYVIQLIVMDAILQSTPDTVIVNFMNIKPVADAGMSQSVYIGDAVTLDGSGSTDENGDTLSYGWTLTSVPAGSASAVTDPTAGATSFVPDVTGTYMVQLVVNDGTVDSDPDTILIQVSSEQTAAIEAVQDCITKVSLLNRRVFMNILLKKIMINRFNRVIANIEAGRYTWALLQLRTEIRFTDGCAKSGRPDRNDWITTCAAQGSVYPSILIAIDAVEALMQ